MRRFPNSTLLQDLVMAGRLEGTQLDGLARRLADFHGTAPVAVPSTDFGTPEQATRAVAAVLSQLRAYCAAARIDTLQSWVDEQAQALRAAWLERQRSGAVRECHGDLHLANAVLVNGELLAFDCVEFDPTLRWIDVMNDVAFLTMDLKAHGRSDQAFRFLDVYLQTSGDYAGMQVLRFYEVYRALVRALVGCLRGGASDGAALSPGPDYLACAEELVRSGGGTARLLITHGLSGSGKSTVAGQLLEAAGAVRIRSDVERKRLFGLSGLQRAADQPLDIYTAEGSRRTFSRLAVCALAALQAGYPVIVDAAFLRRADRQAFRALAARLRLPFAILDCRASEAQLRSRVVARGVAADDASDADPSVLQSQLARQEPLDAGEQALALQVQTDKPIELAALCARWMAAAAEPDSPPASE